MHTNNLRRDDSIDLMKGILALLMMVSHTLTFAGIDCGGFIHYVNLTTFSGFMFCFGYVCNIAYLQKRVLPYKKMLFGAIKLLTAYCASALMYSALVLKNLSASHLGNLLTQRWIAGYSEFLLSWAYLFVLMIICAPILRSAAKNKYVCVSLVVMTLIFTFIDYEKLVIPWLGPIIGYKSYCYFPLIPYFSYFLIGSYFSQNKIVSSKLLYVLSFLISSLYFIYSLRTSNTPQRWGPSFLWVVGAYFYVYIYYVGAKTIKNYTLPFKYLAQIGKRSLFFLLINNLFCFGNSFLNITSQSCQTRIAAAVIVLGGSVALPLMVFAIISKRKKQI